MSTPKKKSIYVAYTGGTIGMVLENGLWVPKKQFLQEQVRNIPAFAMEGMPDYYIDEFQPLIDSSNMKPSDWENIAKHIYDNYDKYDGFVVLHGTDTMAYTASALAFMLQNLDKPVVVTGSQFRSLQWRVMALTIW
eukprot:m.71956 g.71956  ORF g.71956 m.71956 type:complete len:136 (+) comp24408_c0_seq4:60-467(+)